VARRFGLSVEEAAAGLLRVVDAVMAENVKVVSVKQGHDPRDFALVAFGGAGPTHAGALMSELQVPAVLVPPSPGTLCALGLLQTDLRHDGVRTHLRRLDTADPDELARIVAALAGEGRAELAAQGVAVESLTCGLRASCATRARPTKSRCRSTTRTIAPSWPAAFTPSTSASTRTACPSPSSSWWRCA
jgi:N-methylhydantoinase A